MAKFNFLKHPKSGAALLEELKQQRPRLSSYEIRRRMRQAAAEADPTAELRAPARFPLPNPSYKRY